MMGFILVRCIVTNQEFFTDQSDFTNLNDIYLNIALYQKLRIFRSTDLPEENIQTIEKGNIVYDLGLYHQFIEKIDIIQVCIQNTLRRSPINIELLKNQVLAIQDILKVC